jgi:hypothetical protein
MSTDSYYYLRGRTSANCLGVALYRSQLWQKTFLILDDVVQSVDERVAARMEMVALDLQEAILKRHAALAHSATEEEALCVAADRKLTHL